jgi:hypothetical protein
VSNQPSPSRNSRRLAAALAQLRRGLREGDDPLYDPWRNSKVAPKPSVHQGSAIVEDPPNGDCVTRRVRRRSLFSRLSTSHSRWLASVLFIVAVGLAAIAAALLLTGGFGPTLFGR